MIDPVQRLVTAKARSYLRASLSVFTIAVLIAALVVVLVERQHLQNAADFTDNDTVHVVHVTGVADPGSGGYLRFGDADRIRTALATARPEARVEVTPQYALNFGLEGADGEMYFLYGLDGLSEELLGVPRLDGATGYRPVGSRAGDTTLRVPVVSVQDGGMTSSSLAEVPLVLAADLPGDSALAVLDRPDPAAVFVDGATFGTVVSTAYSTSWPEFQERYDAENTFGINAVEGIFVWVEDLADVVPVADTLEELGFATSYTLRAFDDLAASLRSAAGMWLLALMTVTAAAVAHVLVSFNAYLRVSHKDMAILRHLGFTPGGVAAVYRHRARALVLGVLVPALGLLVVASAALPPEARVHLTALNALGVTAVLGLTYVVMSGVLVARHVGRPVLELLRHGRQFE